MRLRKKSLKHPGAILLNNQVFGRDLFVNATTELCIEILDGKLNVFNVLIIEIYSSFIAFF